MKFYGARFGHFILSLVEHRGGAFEVISFTAVVLLPLILAGVGLWVVAKVLRWAEKKVKENPRLPNLSLKTLLRPIKSGVLVLGFYYAIAPLLVLVSGEENVHSVFRICNLATSATLLLCFLWLSVSIANLFERFARSRHYFMSEKISSALRPFIRRALQTLFPLVILVLLSQFVETEIQEFIQRSSSVVVILVVTTLLWQLVVATEKIVQQRYDVSLPDNLKARSIQTQFRVLMRVVLSIICVISVGLILMQFPGVRKFGTSLLASAGVLGIVLGFAAQKTFANIFAGIQMAIAQPIRLDDVVIVEGEWGRIEEIRLTYVVVAIWDQRRLILPITYFLEQPFQNWTRTTSALLGTIFIYADYRLPLDPLRVELQRLCEEAKALWDGRLCKLEVTDARERVMELRALVSARDSSKAWDLRCFIREGIVAFIKKEFPECLPLTRVEIKDMATASQTAAQLPAH